MKYSEYKDLAPINDIKNGDEYLKALDWAFKNPRIKNIALAGPYGAGKSSIIETYLKKEAGENCKKHSIKAYYKKHKFAKKYLKISMATFIEGYNNQEKKINISADEIEEGILKQLFYRVDHTKIPQSRYRKLYAISFKTVLLKINIYALIALLFSKIFIPNICDRLWGKIKSFIMLNKFPSIMSYILAVVIWLFMTYVISCIWKTIASKYYIKEVKLPGKTTIEAEEEKESSVFNKNLDEIMYFFESTSYQVIFFEDLDRIENKKIFVHLRELNNLLNNDNAIRQKPIVFVYAVRDDIFSTKDRTKFFEFIIPVIPIINSTNSGETLLKMLECSDNYGDRHDISMKFVLDISPFISDMRILQNIYNEFIVYKNTLRKGTLRMGQELSLADEQMMAIITFKNLYPRDFADIQEEKGIIKKAFEDKKVFIDSKKKEFEQQIIKKSNLIEIAQSDVLKSVCELKYAMLVNLTNGKGIIKSFYDSKANYRNDLSIEDIMSDEFNMNEILNFKSARCVSLSTSTYRVDLNDYDNMIENYIERWKILKEYEDSGLKGLQDEIVKIKSQQHHLSGKSLKWLLENYPVDEILSEEIKNNKFLVFLLRRGYLNEEYANYINYFKGNSITILDMNFILSVKNQERPFFEGGLIETNMVIQYLQDYEFEQKSIYNFRLLEELLKQEEVGNKLRILIHQLADEDDISWAFIDEFIEKTKYSDKFIQLLSRDWKRIWIYISNKSTLSYDRQLYYLSLLLKHLNSEEIKNINIDRCLTKYFENHGDILQNLKELSANIMIQTICVLEISFNKLVVEDVSEEVIEYIFDNCHFSLNKYMVQQVIQYQNNMLLNNFERKPYSTIIQLKYKPLINYIQKNIKLYIETIVLQHTYIADEMIDILDMLHRILEEENICIQLIKKEKFKLDSLSDCLENELKEKKEQVKIIWDVILSENKLLVTWNNILIYWENYGMTQYLKQFIIVNNYYLKQSENNYMKDTFIKEFIQTDFPYNVIKHLLPLLRMRTFDLKIEELNKKSLEIMIECHYFEFNVQYYDDIVGMYPDIAVKFIINNQQKFVSLLDEFQMTTNLLEQLLFNSEIDSEIKKMLFNQYAEDYMTEYIAENMNNQGFNVTERIFEEAKEYLKVDKKEKLIFDNLELFNNAEKMQECFEELEGDYYDLADRTRLHIVELKATQQNEKLVRHLEKIKYITSWEYKDKDVHNKETGQNDKIKMIRCRVKKKK